MPDNPNHEYIQAVGRMERIPRVRIHLMLSRTTLEWLEAEAMRQTKICGGSVRTGGIGVVSTSEVCEQILTAEIKRQSLTPHRRKPPAEPDPLTDPDRNPDYTIAVEGRREEPCSPDSSDSQ